MKVKELIDYVSKYTFYSLIEVEVSLKEVPQCVAEHLEIEKYRWFSVSTSVYKLEDGFVGIRGVSDIYSDDIDAEDCGVRCTACEYEEFPHVRYKKRILF